MLSLKHGSPFHLARHAQLLVLERQQALSLDIPNSTALAVYEWLLDPEIV